MFQFFKKKSILYSPVNGICIPITEVPDEMFAKKIIGNGVAFRYQENTIYSPCKGEIIMIAETKHAVGIRTADGVEFMIHIGLDTVNLNGKGFYLFVRQGDKVVQGQKLISLDREVFEEQGVDLITPMVVTSKGCSLDILSYGKVDIHTKVLYIH